jgi:hypothetical protein
MSEDSDALVRLVRAYKRTTERERILGQRFYLDAHLYCAGLAYNWGISTEKVAGVVAALSPNNSWLNNRQSAEALLRGDDNGVRSYRRDHIKALWILNDADIYEVLNPYTAPKTHAFFQLLWDGNSNLHICIDGHMANIINGTIKPMKGQNISREEYRRWTSLVLIAAGMFDVDGSVFQATLWIAWRAGLNRGQGRIA